MNRLADIPLESITNTPALVWDLKRLDNRTRELQKFAEDLDCQLLYSMKACSIGAVLNVVKNHVNGFSCSSLFETTLAHQIVGNLGKVHLTTPALNPTELNEYIRTTNYISLNSLTQFERFRATLKKGADCGIRVNPELSQLDDPRYDPCRPNSKLGVPITEFIEYANKNASFLKSITGIHIHTACGNRGFDVLEQQVDKLFRRLPDIFRHIDWFNLGGGYNFAKIRNRAPFVRALEQIRHAKPVDVFIEPGTAVVRDSAYLVATVIDLFKSGDQNIAVLDTTLNHMPEIMVYEFPPVVSEAHSGGKHRYTLAGATCLAGDIFGSFPFADPLEIGSRITFAKVGAYTHGQSHWFNGVNLPAIYSMESSGQINLEGSSNFDDFKRRCAVRS